MELDMAEEGMETVLSYLQVSVLFVCICLYVCVCQCVRSSAHETPPTHL